MAVDPLAGMRRRLDLARVRQATRSPATVLVTHRRGGGTERHVRDEIGRLHRGARGCLIMAGGSAPGTVSLTSPDIAALPSLAAIPADASELAPILNVLGADHFAVHHTIEMGSSAPAFLRDLAALCRANYDVVVHDYFAICPRINLVDTSGHYCGEPSQNGCLQCLARRRSEVGAPDITVWRRAHAEFLRGASQVVVPDNDVAQRLERYVPGLSPRIVPHEPGSTRAVRRRPAKTGPVCIAVVGAIGPIKGFDVLLSLGTRAARAARGDRVVVIGYTRNDRAAKDAGIEVTGPYREAEVQSLIDTVDPDLIFIPSTWPETYCYTLSHALASGRPVAAFDLGAQGRRLAEHHPSGVIPLDLANDPKALLERLLLIARDGEGCAIGRQLSESTMAP